MSRILTALAASWALATSVAAQSAAPIDQLIRVMGMSEIIEIMADEGRSYGGEMQQDLLSGRGGPRWGRQVAEIYDVPLMTQVFRSRLDSELAAEDLGPMIDFFASERGQEIVTLEVSAREAFLQDGIEEAGLDMYRQLERDGAPRVEQIQELIEVADLVDSNVVGALNANYAFMTGLSAGGALPVPMSDGDILADVWAQEPEIRKDSIEWLQSYLNMAYTPLSDDDLAAYIAFYDSAPGQKLNTAVFAAYDALFTQISHQLGQAASDYLAGEEL